MLLAHRQIAPEPTIPGNPIRPGRTPPCSSHINIFALPRSNAVGRSTPLQALLTVFLAAPGGVRWAPRGRRGQRSRPGSATSQISGEWCQGTRYRRSGIGLVAPRQRTTSGLPARAITTASDRSSRRSAPGNGSSWVSPGRAHTRRYAWPSTATCRGLERRRLPATPSAERTPDRLQRRSVARRTGDPGHSWARKSIVVIGRP
jgi:hypothetical protein